MVILKCKMCGGDLVCSSGSSVVICKHCGTEQTVPATSDHKKLKLFTHANRWRASCEFDKAAGIYESIVADYPEEAEAYWGLVLCKYGIEYVDDPQTGRKVPTCHRTSFSSVLEDLDLKLAMAYADNTAKLLYWKEAQQIEVLRKEILAVSAKEAAYDIFICYKESDIQGDRTLDSVIAQDIYDALTELGYRVFFSRITLEEKLGHSYEPYIFSALHSAKVMLVFGTSYDNFHAVWVKNEWNRYLSLIAQGEEKTLIPCYQMDDIQDLPQEFLRLQAQDMGKVGALQDLLRGIDKIFGKDAPALRTAPAEEVPLFETSHPRNKILVAGLILLLVAAATLIFLSTGKENLSPEVMDVPVVTASPQLESSVQTEPEITDPDYLEAEQLLADGKKYEAAVAFYAIKNKYDARERSMEIWAQITQRKTIFAGGCLALAITNDGAVLYTGRAFDNQESVSSWKDIVDLGAGVDFCVGLRKNGTVAAAGWNLYGQCEVSDWYDIVSVATGYAHTVGLRADGTVVAVGNNYSGQCEVSEWTDIIAIAAGNKQTVGLKKDGTVVAVGFNDDGQCAVSGWSDIVKISAAWTHTVGLKADGTAVATGWNYYNQCDVSEWNNLIDITAYTQTVGLKTDGIIVSTGTGSNEYEQSDVSEWTDVISISTGDTFTMGLRSNGTVLATGSNDYGQCDVSTWNDIKLPE